MRCLASGKYLFREALKDDSAVGIRQIVTARPFRVRHHPEDIFPFIANPCNVVERPIGIAHGVDHAVLVAVLEQNLIVVFERLEPVLARLWEVMRAFRRCISAVVWPSHEP